MKEKIYTIPLNDSFDQPDCCPFCFLENKLEKNLVDYTLGPSMMEPDSRENSNQTGFCRMHLNMMLRENKRLSFALLLSTHLEYLEKAVDGLQMGEQKGGLFRKKNNGTGTAALREASDGCVICRRMEDEMERYLKVFFYLWEKEEEFRKKAEARTDVCVRHGRMLLEEAPAGNSEAGRAVVRLLKTSLSARVAELKQYIDLFDYRSNVTDPSAHKEAVPKAVAVARGSVENI